MLSATFTGMVTRHYEASFAALPLLVSFMPMLMDTPGNCGNQACTLMVRGLALGEVTVRDMGRVVWKELRISLLVGAILGVVNGFRIFLMYDVFADVFGTHKDPNAFRYMIVVSVALMAAIVLAKLVGAVLPLLAKLVGADPAIMATPFITTIVDAGSLIIYFHIAEIVFASEIAQHAVT
jgi:magnesium transporter